MLKHVGGIEMVVEFSSSMLESVLEEEMMWPSSIPPSGSSKYS